MVLFPSAVVLTLHRHPRFAFRWTAAVAGGILDSILTGKGRR